MRSLLLSGLFMFLFCHCNAQVKSPVSQVQAVQGISRVQADSVHALISKFPNQTQFAIALIHGSEVSYYGVLRANDTLLNISNEDSLFEIGSISKVFTSSLLAQMAEEGKLNPEDPVSAYLPFPLKDSIRISFQQLANHTSGLPRLPPSMFMASLMHPDNPYKTYDREKLIKYMREDMSLQREAGSAYEYSNLGAGMLGFVLEEISGQTYEQLLQQKISIPLGMQHTTTDRARAGELLVKGLSPTGEITSNWDLAALMGAGGILSSSQDLSKFILANFDTTRHAFNLQRKQTFKVNESLGLALGWHIMYRPSGESWYWHNGGTGGYRSSMVLDVPNRKGVVLLSNMSAGYYLAGEIDQLSFFLLEQMK
ncbi:MAG: serine hydrolase domain-containing protein [Cyclobacteriaceae bacterium]